MLKPGKKGEIQRKVRRASECLKAGDLNNAGLYFEEALAIDPKNKKALAGLGEVARQKKIQEHLLSGQAFLEHGHPGEAEKELRQVISLDPKNSEAINILKSIAKSRIPLNPPLVKGETIKPFSKAAGVSRIQKAPDADRIESLADFLRKNRLETRRRNLDFLLISAVAHILALIILSLFVTEIVQVPKEEISVEWVKVEESETLLRRSVEKPRERYRITDMQLSERETVEPAFERTSRSGAQSVKPGLMARSIEAKSGAGAQPQTFSSVDMPSAEPDMKFSPSETTAMGSSISKPGPSDRTGAGRSGRSLGGLSNIGSSATAGSGFSALDLGGLGGTGLVGPDPMNMVSAVTAGRQDEETVVFLLDISNSMEGNYGREVHNREWFKKLKRAKRSIKSSLYRLREDKDKFYLVAFSSSYKLFDTKPVVVSKSNLSEATKFVDELLPATHRERTNMYGALMSAMKVDPTRIMLVSDGLPTEGVVGVKNILNGVKQNNKSAMIYTFATNLGGEEEARGLLSKLARDNAGKFSEDKMGLPRGIAVNSNGHVYVADIRINVFDKSDQLIRSFGSHATKLAIGPDDDIHLLFDPEARRSGFGALGVCRSDGTQLKSFADFGHLPQQLYEPWDVAVDSKGRTYAVSTRSNMVSIFDKDGKFVDSFGSAGMKAYRTGPSERGDSLTGGSRGGGIDRRGVDSTEAGFLSRPMGVALDSYDNIFVLDSGNRRVQMFSPQLHYTGEFRIDGWGMSIDVDANGNYIYVLMGSNHSGGENLVIYRPNGGVVEKFEVGSGTADIDVDSSGNIYALNFVYDEVNIFSSKGEHLRSFSTIQ